MCNEARTCPCVTSLISIRPKKCVPGSLRDAYGLWNISPIGMWQNNKYNYGMMMNIIEIMIDLLNGTMVIKNEKHK